MGMNCFVLLGGNIAIRADEVQRIQTGIKQTTVTMTDGRQYSTDMSVRDVADAVNSALQSARAALQQEPKP